MKRLLSILIAAICLTSCNSPNPHKLGKYIYLDSDGVYHSCLDCRRIKPVVERLPAENLRSEDLDGYKTSFCPKCITDDIYERITAISQCNDNLKLLYDNLEAEEYDLPTYGQFVQDMADSSKLRRLHNTLTQDGWKVPGFDTFQASLGFGPKPRPKPDRTDRNTMIEKGIIVLEENDL